MAYSKEPRWMNVERPYSVADVKRLSGSVNIEYTLAKKGAEKLWNQLHHKKYVSALGALTGNQAMQQARRDLIQYIFQGGKLQEMQMIVCKCILTNPYMQLEVFLP